MAAKGKIIATSSQSSTIFNYKDGSYLWFQTKEDLDRYVDHFEYQRFILPRFSTKHYIEFEAPTFIRDVLKQCRLIDFITLEANIIHPPLIKAFYSNIKIFNKRIWVTYINGVSMPIDEKIVQTITKLPTEEGDDLIISREEMQKFLHEIGIEVPTTTNSRYISIKGMNDNCRILHHYITQVIKPRWDNDHLLSHEDARLLYCIIRHKRINWCKVVLSHMIDTFEKQLPLPYAALIEEYFRHYKVNVTGPFLRKTMYDEINNRNLCLNGVIESEENNHLKTISSQLTELISNVSQIRQDLNVYLDHVRKSQKAIIEDDPEEQKRKRRK